jgi:hypothetical protein
MDARKIAVVIGALVLGGCTHNDDFPAKWPSPASGGCAAVSGTYSNFGEFGELHVVAPPGTDLRPRLALRFFQSELSNTERVEALKRADRVVLAYGDGALSVEVRDGATIVATARFSQNAKTMTCTREGAVIPGYSGWARGAGNPLMGREFNEDVLIPAADGALIVRYHGGGTGMVYGVMPFSGSGDSWLRWPRLGP